MSDNIRKAAKKVREATTSVEAYVGQDIKFWSDFAQNADKLDDLMESILYIERKRGFAYEHEVQVRWIIKEIIETAKGCKIQLNKPKPKVIKRKTNSENII